MGLTRKLTDRSLIHLPNTSEFVLVLAPKKPASGRLSQPVGPLNPGTKHGFFGLFPILFGGAVVLL